MAARSPLYWLSERRSDVPQDTGWLTPREREFAGRLKIEKRRADWILGRWTAKRALRAYLSNIIPGLDVSEIDIRAADDGAPEAFLGNTRCPAAISLSHSAGIGLCVVTETTIAPGCDVEYIEDRGERFVSDYFLAGERNMVLKCDAAERAMMATLIWSAKESALKILRRGLRRDTRSVRVQPVSEYDSGVWNAFSVTCTETHRRFYGWWRSGDGYIATVAADADIGTPVALGCDSVIQDPLRPPLR
jgi:4'-phosphopantetheinyl transferase